MGHAQQSQLFMEKTSSPPQSVMRSPRTDRTQGGDENKGLCADQQHTFQEDPLPRQTKGVEATRKASAVFLNSPIGGHKTWAV